MYKEREIYTAPKQIWKKNLLTLGNRSILHHMNNINIALAEEKIQQFFMEQRQQQWNLMYIHFSAALLPLSFKCSENNGIITTMIMIIKIISNGKSWDDKRPVRGESQTRTRIWIEPIRNFRFDENASKQTSEVARSHRGRDESSSLCEFEKFIGSLVLAFASNMKCVWRHGKIFRSVKLGCDREIIIFMNVNGITFDLRQFPIFEEEFSLYFYIQETWISEVEICDRIQINHFRSVFAANTRTYEFLGDERSHRKKKVPSHNFRFCENSQKKSYKLYASLTHF